MFQLTSLKVLNEIHYPEETTKNKLRMDKNADKNDHF